MGTHLFKELLHKRDLKATSQRIKLLERMDDFSSAMPYSAIQKAMEPIDRVTLYRTLEILAKKGIIHKAHVEDNESYYALCGFKCSESEHRHEHIHFKCQKCKSVTCQELSERVKIDLPNFEIHKVNVHVDGVCQECK